MKDDVIQDLKQFITNTLTQQLADVRGDIATLNIKFDKLESKVEDIDSKTDAILEAVGESFENHEQRITKLEQATA